MTDPTTPIPSIEAKPPAAESRQARWRRRLTSTAAKLAAGALAILLVAGFGGFAIGHAAADGGSNGGRGDHGWHGHPGERSGFDGDGPRGLPSAPVPPTTAPETEQS